MCIIAAAGAILNAVTGHVCTALFSFPVFLDTVFIIAITFAFGLLGGAICGALTSLLILAISSAVNSFDPFFLSDLIHFLTHISFAVVTWLFMKIFARELNFKKGAWEPLPIWNKSSSLSIAIDKFFVLIILSFLLCLISGISSELRIVSFGIRGIMPSQILYNILLNTLDKTICVYAGLFLSYALRSFFKVSSQRP